MPAIQCRNRKNIKILAINIPKENPIPSFSGIIHQFLWRLNLFVSSRLWYFEN